MPLITAVDENARDVTGFLQELTQLSRVFGLGIAGPITLFEMKSDDYEREYRRAGDQAEFI